jgi:hypothetical protein
MIKLINLSIVLLICTISFGQNITKYNSEGKTMFDRIEYPRKD